MKINGEECELVTSFESLRAGDVIWNKACRTCGADHRAMLVSFVKAHTDRGEEQGWSQVPVTDSCHTGTCKRTVTTARCRAMIEGRLYRVINPPNARATERKRELARG